MNFHQLKCFCLVAELGNFSKAAERMYISQSAVTQQISSLEREIDVKLLERTTKKVSFTPAGKIFYEGIKEPLKEISVALVRAKDTAQKEEVSLTIGCYNVTHERYMTRLLSAFMVQCPHAIPTVLPMRPQQILPALSMHQIDCGFMVPADVEFDKIRYNFTPLCQQRLYAVMSKTHPLANKNELSPEQLRGYTARAMFIAPSLYPETAYTTLQIEAQILESLKNDALPYELRDGKTELMQLRGTNLIITRPNYTIPEDNSLATVPLVHEFMPEYGIVTLPDCKKIAKEFIRMAVSKKGDGVFDL